MPQECRPVLQSHESRLLFLYENRSSLRFKSIILTNKLLTNVLACSFSIPTNDLIFSSVLLPLVVFTISHLSLFSHKPTRQGQSFDHSYLSQIPLFWLGLRHVRPVWQSHQSGLLFSY